MPYFVQVRESDLYIEILYRNNEPFYPHHIQVPHDVDASDANFIKAVRDPDTNQISIVQVVKDPSGNSVTDVSGNSVTDVTINRDAVPPSMYF